MKLLTTKIKMKFLVAELTDFASTFGALLQLLQTLAKATSVYITDPGAFHKAPKNSEIRRFAAGHEAQGFFQF
jgi:hypothetical protein